MKRHLLLSFAAALLFVFVLPTNAQNAVENQLVRTGIPMEKQILDDNAVGHMIDSHEFMQMANDPMRSSSSPGEIVGLTGYDFQTNASIDNRIVNHGDGQVSVAWTFSFGGNDDNRGTGWNHFDGSAWETVEADHLAMTRIEPEKTGWPSIGVTENGRQYSVAHTVANGCRFTWREAGETEWQSQLLNDYDGVTNDVDLTWPRATATGNTIHIIGSHFDGDWPLDNPVAAGLHYIRSNDGGDTFETIPIPQLNGDFIGIFGGDAYAIHANGDNVAIVGSPAAPSLWKSTDGGDTWTITYLQNVDNPLAGTPNGDPTWDATLTSDGAFDVTVGADGVAHVFWGRSVTLWDDPAAAGYSTFPSTTTGIIYWNDSWDVSAVNTLGKTVVRDTDGDMLPPLEIVPADVPDATTINWNLQSTSGMSSFPSSGMDAEGNLYLVWTAIVEGANDDEGYMFRDAFAAKSLDGGNTWIGPVNITDSPEEDCAFACLAKLVDENMHVLFQADDMTGWGGAQNPTQDGINVNEQHYLTVSVDDIVDPATDFNTVPCWEVLFALNEGDNLGVGVGCPPVDYIVSQFGVDAWDYPDGGLNSAIVLEPAVFDSPGVQEAIYTLSDSDGNEVHTFEYFENLNYISDNTQVVPVEAFEDTTPPEVTLIGDAEITILIDTDYEDQGVTVLDDFDGIGCGDAVDNLVIDNGGFDISVAGVYTFSYTATDAAGNPTTVTRTVIVVGEDTEDPIITLTDLQGIAVVDEITVNGTSDAGTTFFGSGFAPLVSVDDNLSDLSPDDVVISGTVDLSTIGDYEITYTVTDDAGNQTDVIIVVHVVDEADPFFALQGVSNIPVECGENWQESPLIDDLFLSDNLDGVMLNVLSGGDDVDNSCNGSFLVNVGAIDAVGLTSVTSGEISIDVSGCEDNCDGTGIEDEILNASIQLMPNPTNGLVTLNISNLDQDISVEVYDVQGKVVISEESYSASQAIVLDLSDKIAGIYMVRISNDTATTIKRVMLKK